MKDVFYKVLFKDALPPLFYRGISPDLRDKILVLCEECFSQLKLKSQLSTLVEKIYRDKNLSDHHFATAFYSVAIALEVGFQSQKNIEIIFNASILHDLARLDEYSSSLNYPDENTKYINHTVDTYNMLKDIPNIPEALLQMIYQHHENAAGKGFPNKLEANRIYPLAKPLILSTFFTNTITDNEITPIEAIKKILQDSKTRQFQFGDHLKALALTFSNSKINKRVS